MYFLDHDYSPIIQSKYPKYPAECPILKISHSNKFVYSYKRLLAEIFQMISEGEIMDISEIEWMVSETFFEKLTDYSYKWLI